MDDRFNRTIDYARISLTSKCNLKCEYCMPKGARCCNDKLTLDDYNVIINGLSELGFKKIRFTGGEPLLSPFLVPLVELASSKIGDVSITSNATLLGDKLLDLKKAGLKRINISLDTLDRQKYLSITKSDKLLDVINNIKLLKQYGLEVKLNTVLLKGVNDDEIEAFLKFGMENDIQVRFIELMKIGDNKQLIEDRYISSYDAFKNIDIKEIDNKEKKDVCRYFTYNNYEFGVISAISNHFCNDCNKIRITSEGKLRLCLHSDEDIDIKNALNIPTFTKLIEDKIGLKPEKHKILDNEISSVSMYRIGG